MHQGNYYNRLSNISFMSWFLFSMNNSIHTKQCCWLTVIFYYLTITPLCCGAFSGVFIYIWWHRLFIDIFSTKLQRYPEWEIYYQSFILLISCTDVSMCYYTNTIRVVVTYSIERVVNIGKSGVTLSGKNEVLSRFNHES